MSLRVGLIAGEASGDLLGAGLIRAIRQHYPDAYFEGVAGPAMIEAGCQAWMPSERLSVMGLAEVARHLPGLLRLRRDLVQRFATNPPDVVIGIDSPDFNLGVEAGLRARGLRTVHYVSPSIWAWRPGRIRRMRRSADLVLCLLPFETAPYEAAGMNASFVGHPLADRIPRHWARDEARQALGMDRDGTVIAVLPGSRAGEVDALGDDFAGAIKWLYGRRPELRFVIPMVGIATRESMRAALAARAAEVPVQLLEGRSLEVMAAADVVLLASGTATLEAALLKRPMVVAYRLAPATRWLLETFRLLKIDRFALPNILAGRDFVPEILQDAVTPASLGEAVLAWLDDPARRARLVQGCEEIHTQLRRGADAGAAAAVLALCGRLPGTLAS
jgi:lipid-A-disaccharide synthase